MMSGKSLGSPNYRLQCLSPDLPDGLTGSAVLARMQPSTAPVPSLPIRRAGCFNFGSTYSLW